MASVPILSARLHAWTFVVSASINILKFPIGVRSNVFVTPRDAYPTKFSYKNHWAHLFFNRLT